jgi:hypothetical protein
VLTDLNTITKVGCKSKHALVVSELVSSSHDELALTIFLTTLKYSYIQLFSSVFAADDGFYFRLVVIDSRLASLHAVLHAICRDEVHSYAKRVFKLAKGEAQLTNEKSWIATRASNTMHRFCKSIDKLSNINKTKRAFFCLSFSLLLNSQTLDEISSFYRSMVVVCFSKVKTNPLC